LDGEAEEGATDWLVDLECALVDRVGWSLVDIDATDIESLIPFMFRYPAWKGEGKTNVRRQKLYADEASWL
jgi:hypothetical protein